MAKSYKEMTINELLIEEQRVKSLLIKPKDYFTYNQNKKYLERLERKLRQCQRH